MTDLIQRLNAARIAIEKVEKADDPELMGKMAKKFQSLHAECYSLWVDNNFADDCKEFHYAQFLKYSIILYFALMFDYGGESYELAEMIGVESWKAGLSRNKITGKMID